MPFSKRDHSFMRRCLELAKNGEGGVSPNPLVGAVLEMGGKIIGEGCHEKFGGPHAEANAIAGAKSKRNPVPGATLYVSLEPCSHTGKGKKTPPCVPLIIKSGVARVVAATADPNPKVSGGGFSALRLAGVRVDAGLLENEAQELNEPFFKFISTGKPYVIAKIAQSADGIIGIKGRGRMKISGRPFYAYCHRMRNRYDSILVGAGTVLEDDPYLTCRMKGGRNPVRIMLDSSLRIPLSAKVLRNAKKDRVIIFTASKFDKQKAKKLQSMGVHVIKCGKEKVDIKKMLSLLPKMGICSVLVEGGAQTARSFLKSNLVDRLVVAISPKKLGGGKGAIRSPITPAILRSLKEKRKSSMGADTLIEGRLT